MAAPTQMVLLCRKTAEERIASFILDMAEGSGDCDRVTLLMTRPDIGDHLGLTMERVSRALAQLKKERVIELVNCRDLFIRDHDTLEDLVEPA
jgi:CRP-like cAMP-binding protein